VTHPSGARLLVVDDEQAILRVVQINLSRHDFQVETARTAQDGLDAVARLHPDLILLDLGLPDMDGLDVIRTIRQRANTPIVVLSARETEHDKVAALDLGADDYLTKPFGINELLARVRVALRHAAGPTTGTAAVISWRWIWSGGASPPAAWRCTSRRRSGTWSSCSRPTRTRC
jgi:two-component system KDP operon response regulator KdpE